jgi:hypothetical protein
MKRIVIILLCSIFLLTVGCAKKPVEWDDGRPKNILAETPIQIDKGTVYIYNVDQTYSSTPIIINGDGIIVIEGNSHISFKEDATREVGINCSGTLTIRGSGTLYVDGTIKADNVIMESGNIVANNISAFRKMILNGNSVKADRIQGALITLNNGTLETDSICIIEVDGNKKFSQFGGELLGKAEVLYITEENLIEPIPNTETPSEVNSTTLG